MKSLTSRVILRTGISIFSLFCTTTVLQAQTSASSVRHLQIALEARPSDDQFRAGLSELDEEDLRVKVWFTNPQQEKVIIYLTDPAGNTLYTKTFTEAQYAQVYNLTSLEDGLYTFTFLKGKEVFQKTVHLSSNSYTIRRKQIQ